MEEACQGFSGQSFCKVIIMLGLTSEATKTAAKATEKDTRWLWISTAVLWANLSETQVGA